MLLGLGIGTLVVAWISSQVVTPAWVVRYFAPAIPAMLMLLAIGISRAGVVGAVAMIFLVLFMARPSAFEPAYKSDMQGIAGEVAPMLHKRDLVIVGQPESTPLAYYYLPGGLKWANTMGPVRIPATSTGSTRSSDTRPRTSPRCSSRCSTRSSPASSCSSSGR